MIYDGKNSGHHVFKIFLKFFFCHREVFRFKEVNLIHLLFIIPIFYILRNFSLSPNFAYSFIFPHLV